MSIADIAIADVAVVVIIVLAGLIAFMLGFVRVVLALAGWVGAAFATLYGFPYVRPLAREVISIGFVADAAAGAGIFILALIVLTIISHMIGGRIRSSALSAIDRSLGLVFGLFLGGVVVSLTYLGLVWAIDLRGKQPDWYRDARSRPAVEWSAEKLLSLVPPGWRGPGAMPADQNTRRDIERTFRQFLEPRAEAGARRREPGYPEPERREMDRLIKSHQ